MSEEPNLKSYDFEPGKYLFDKSYICPVCEDDFKARVVRYGKPKLVSTDTDLRPYYTPVDPIHYEVIICPYCGYAAINMNFDKMTDRIAEKIKNEIKPKFVKKEYPPVYDAEIGIERYKMALRVSAVKGANTSEKAYINMKMNWLYRELEDGENERKCMQQALDYFKEAYQKERFPICGIDENTYMYIIGEMERRLGNNDEAMRWFGKLVTSKNIEPRLKERAMDQKDIISKNAGNLEVQSISAEAMLKAEQATKDKPAVLESKPNKKLFGFFK